ncbi:phosphodiester glycosidase family protein [Enterococcus timonensis]|uniref:phosphodiester glycosidase family protein n=1 Tax=Enterococcus timonensis TaxID=1852364 RepID=UPI0008D94824|nr:phosphodiester glycosidase family protein [Enterococcus timonensis]
MKKIVKRTLITISTVAILAISGILIFFKTNIFQTYRDLWVQTAMTTSSHQWLATTFLSQEEIDNILANYVVTNDENSSAALVAITDTDTDSQSATDSTTSENTSITEISGDTYTGYVVTIKDPTTVQLINTLNADNTGTELSETVSENNIQVAINAAGFNFSRSRSSSANSDANSSSGTLDSLTIIDSQLLYGDETETYPMIGLTAEGKLLLGNYTYQEALDAGIDDAISFSPFLIVNGNEQITETETGGYQPRTAIGQAADGTFYFVVIEGRSTTSLGATLYDLQEIMKNLGAVNAVNLDGGGSSELFYDGTLVNDLSNGSERSIPNAFIVTD